MKLSKSLVKRLKNHEEEAFDEIYHRYYRLVKHVVFQIIPNETISEDLAQETFLRMFENIDTFDNSQSFTAWLCTICRNLALTEKSKRNRYSQLPEDTDIKDESNPSPVQVYENLELIEKLKKILSKDEYDLFFLKAYHKLSYKELSELSGKSIPLLTTRYNRIVKKIKDKIKL